MRKMLILVSVMFFGFGASAYAETEADHAVVIVGGGMAGMTAAYYAKEHDLIVLEKRQDVGGRAFSLEHNGFVYACGAEYLGRLYGPLERIVTELGLTVREIPYPMDVYFDRGKFYYGEMGRAQLASKKAGLKEFRRFAKTVQEVYQGYQDIPEMDMAGPLARLDQISAHDWFSEEGFHPFFFKKYNVTFKGLFGANIRDISALGSLTEIAFDFEGVDVDEEFSDLEDQHNVSTPGAFKTGAYSFDTGIARIPTAVRAHLGDRVRVNAEVTHVEKEGEIFRIRYTSKGGKEETVTSDAVILATPAPVTLDIARTVLSQDQQEILAQVNYAPFVTLALFSSQPIFNKGFDLAVPDGFFFTDVYDATWIPRFYNPGLKDVNTYITTVYISAPTHTDRSILKMTDQQILAATFADLEKIFPGVQKKVQGHKIFRFTYGYPVMTKGAYERLTRLHKITRAPVVLAGDYTIYPTLEAAADSGVLAAEKIIDWLDE